ncbi:MAG: hypothetical protein M1483_04980 [Actinobacteria bacterium]|nr:hypothetical protein [Actinomycetota bacterium]MCL6104968.1 hypothetical protein [Actinomycetota bacterium]
MRNLTKIFNSSVVYAGAAVLWSGWASGLHTFTIGAAIATGIPGVVIIGYALFQRIFAHSRQASLASPPPKRELGYMYKPSIVVWSLLLSATVTWELIELFSGPRINHPTVSSLIVGAFDASRFIRWAAFFTWVIFGWWLSRLYPADWR